MLRNGWDGVYRLVKQDGTSAKVGEPVQNFRGEPGILADGSPPWKSSSEGHVSVKGLGIPSAHESYAGVYNLKWVKHA